MCFRGLGGRTSNREVPRHERNSNADGLLDSKDSTVGRRRCLHRSLNTLGLASKPPGEAQSIVELALSFKEWFASLISDDVGQVVTVLTYQRVPLEETLGASSWVDFAESLEGFVGGFDGCVGVFCDVVWCCCPYFAVAWVWCWAC
jgi:hypothetical protein